MTPNLAVTRLSGAPGPAAIRGSSPTTGFRNPRLSGPPVGALEARLMRAFRLLAVRSAPVVSMLYGRARAPVCNRVTGYPRGHRR